MTDVGEKLYKLQQIDLSLRKNEKRLQAIDAELSNHVPVQKAKKVLAAAESKLKPLQNDLRDLELQVQSTKEKRDSSEKRLYGGTVSNPKELQDIEQNIAALKRWQAELEDKQLELMVGIEAAEESLNIAHEKLKQVIAEAATSNTDLLAEKENLEAETNDLNAERETVRLQLELADLNLYEELLPKMAFHPIATLTDDRMCSICGVQQTSLHVQAIRQRDELLRCANCNRILIAI